MENKLMEFLKSDETQHTFKVNKYGREDTLIVIKYKYDKNNIFLYTQCVNELEIVEKLNYAGFYNLKSNMFYDIRQYYLNNISIPQDKIVNYRELKENINNLIIDRCRQIIRQNFKDINNLKLGLDLNDICKRNIEYYKEYAAKETAKNYFLNGISIDNIEIRINNFNNIPMDNILKYIDNDNSVIDEIATEYVTLNFDSIHTSLLCNEMVKKELLNIQKDKTNILHTRKAIRDSLTSQKTVNVTIFKDNKEFTFKTDAEALKRESYHSKYYSTWYMQAKDRKKFEELFGRSSDYTADEIIKITYCKKPLYVKEAA